MKALELYKKLIEEVGVALKQIGYARKGNCFYIQRSGNWGLIDFQKSRKSQAGEIIFTINLGICSKKLLQFYMPDISEKKPSIDICHWRERLGYVLPYHQDKWWVIHDVESFKLILNELKKGLIEIAIPTLYHNLTDEQLRHEWLRGKSPGLTDIQRLMNLAVLLKASGENKLLEQISKELKEKSVGKPVEFKVKVHLESINALDGIIG